MGSGAGAQYDPQAVSRFYDGYGEREWDRLDGSPRGRIAYAIHSAMLFEHIEPGMRVADVGCGPGRFAMAMIRAGAKVTLVDISSVQLDAALARIDSAGLRHGVQDVRVADVCELHGVDDSFFDAVVCFGGALSYARERHREGLRELIRIARPGAPILFSVMSLLGTLMLAGTLDSENFLARIAEHIDWLPQAGVPPFALTLAGSDEFHLPMALFTAGYLEGLLTDSGCELLAMAASNPISRMGLGLERIAASPEAVAQLEAIELAMSRYPGVLDGGEHIVVAGRKRPSARGASHDDSSRDDLG